MRPLHVAAAHRARARRGLSLNDTLAQLGWTTRRAEHGCKEVYNRNGEFVGCMTASDVWEHLRNLGLIEVAA